MRQSQELERAENRPEEESRLVLLAASAAGGDEAAFADLYTLLSQRVFNLVLRSVHDRPTAEDICQEIWLKAHSEIRNLKAPDALRSWLYRIASHACIDYARSARGKHRKDESDIDEFIVAYGPQPEDSAIVDSEVRMVWETLGAMAPRQSVALYLRQVDGLSYDEIAAVLDCSRPTVEALLFRARQSFVRAYERVESSPAERCELFAQVMAGIIDNEPTPLQRSALESHAADCAHCRRQLVGVRKANRAYLALPLLPIGKGLAFEAILAGGSTAAGTGIVSTVAGLLGVGAFQAKVALVGAILVAGSLAAATQVDVPVLSEALGNQQQVTLSANTPATATSSTPATASQGPGQTVSDLSFPVNASANRDPTSSAVPASASAPSSTTLSPADPGTQTREGPTAPPLSPTPTGNSQVPSATDGSTADAETTSPTQDPGTQPPAGEGSAPPGTPPAPAPETVAQSDPAGSLQQTVDNLTDLTAGTLNDVGVVAGDTLEAVAQPVATVTEPVDNVVQNLTGLSVNETLDDVLNALPSSEATPVPLDETLDDVLEPVNDLLQDPLQPVENVLQDPLEPVQDLTGPLLQPTPAPSQQPAATPQSGSQSSQEPPATPEDGPCLLGLLFC